jgi:DNA-binding transcriptional ArsR family regulator
MPGDADIAATAALLGDRARARIVTTLGDGRALPASVLADEAGVAPSTASEHLARLVEGGLLTAERHGRHRYFRLAGGDVARMLEAMARVSPPAPVTSLRDGTRANALRNARTCYDHLAGRLGTGLMAAMISGDLIEGGDGLFDPQTARRDRLSGRGHDIDYRLTVRGTATLAAFGADLHQPTGRRPFVGYCVDWSEQRHHISGAVGAAILDRMLELAWIVRQPRGRAVWITPAGADGLRETFGLEPEAASYAASANPRTNGSISSAGTGLLNR